MCTYMILIELPPKKVYQFTLRTMRCRVITKMLQRANQAHLRSETLRTILCFYPYQLLPHLTVTKSKTIRLSERYSKLKAECPLKTLISTLIWVSAGHTCFTPAYCIYWMSDCCVLLGSHIILQEILCQFASFNKHYDQDFPHSFCY